jgi:hypothetical protein|tara:strand:+ start:497 stop:868 length:372 start_codon:yes stop_codon:yes gene_type:complete
MGSIMATWSDSRVVSGTVASVSETQVGSNINIPQNQTWLITSIWGAHPQGGTFRLAVDSLPGLNGTYVHSSNDVNTMGTDAGSASVYPQNFVIAGPAVVQLFTTNAAATSGTAKAMLSYQVTQ